MWDYLDGLDLFNEIKQADRLINKETNQFIAKEAYDWWVENCNGVF